MWARVKWDSIINWQYKVQTESQPESESGGGVVEEEIAQAKGGSKSSTKLKGWCKGGILCMLLIGLNAFPTNITSPISKTTSFPSRNMLDIFRGLKSLVKVNHIKTDSPIFRLHYSITVMILMSFSLIVTTRQYVGNPIDCIHTKDVPEDVLNTFCWIHSTYTMKHLFTKKVGEEVAYPGVGTSQLEKVGNVRAEPKIYRYYQWVCFCLFFQVKFFSYWIVNFTYIFILSVNSRYAAQTKTWPLFIHQRRWWDNNHAFYVHN